jgi:membrane protease YdiL (CAAX protease family)
MLTNKSIPRLVQKYPVTAYCLLAFLITWGSKYWYALVRTDGYLPPFNFSLIAQFGPSLAGVFLISLTEGVEGIRHTVKSMLNWHVKPGWILLAFGFEPMMFFSFTLLYWLKYGEFLNVSGATLASSIAAFGLTFVIGLFRWGLAEEIGWRGWMFPKLQSRMSPFMSSIALAVVMTLWHTHPSLLSEIAVSREGAYLSGYFPETIERLIITIPITLVQTFIFINTQGSLLLMMIYHSASNTSYFFIAETFGIVETDFFKKAFLTVMVIIGVVFSILVMKQEKGESPMAHANYLFRKKQLMKAFDKSLEFAKPTVSSWLGEERANRFMREARQEYEALMPRIPYIGNNWLLLSFFIPTTRYLAMYRALQRQGRTVEDAGRLAYLIGTEEAKAYPHIVRRFMEYLWFSRLFRALAKRWQIRSRQGRYPGASVIEYIEGDGGEFDYGIDYIECAVCKFLRAENAFELTPYSCAIDKPVSDLMGWGLTRLKTLAEGYPRCEFRFKKGGKTNVPIPSSLKA